VQPGCEQEMPAQQRPPLFKDLQDFVLVHNTSYPIDYPIKMMR
jgi:hypothetical protein